MNRQEAKQILLLYGPGLAEAGDSRMAEALKLTRQDEELRKWLEQHCAFQAAVRKKFQQIEAPRGLRARILAQQQMAGPPGGNGKPLSGSRNSAGAAPNPPPSENGSP